MADTTVTKLPIIVVETEGSPATSVITITAPMLPNSNEVHDLVLSVVVGSIKFAVGTAAVAGSPSYTSASGRFVLKVNNDNKLNFLAAAQNDSFLIEN